MMKKRSRLLNDAGYATVASSGIIIAAVSLLIAVAAIAGHVSARHEAQVAADMAAISGAFALTTGGDGCVEAAEIAKSNNGILSECTILGGDLQVSVSVRSQSARAQAGPY